MKDHLKIANNVAMKFYLGQKGLDESWQDKFSPTTSCVHCGGESRIAFVGKEEGKGDFVSELHENEKGALWPHDAIAVATYLCKDCLEPTSIFNQA